MPKNHEIVVQLAISQTTIKNIRDKWIMSGYNLMVLTVMDGYDAISI
jgi:hypothetical protein